MSSKQEIEVCLSPPQETISNKDLAESFRTEGITTKTGQLINEEWIIERTGISQRHREPGLPHLAVPFKSLVTARETLKAKGWSPQDLDFIGVVTSFPVGQNLAVYLKEKLAFQNGRRGNLEAGILEVNAACSGFTVLLHHLKENEERFRGKKILLIATEQYSPYLYGLDQAIFSDFTLGVAFEYGKDLEVLTSHLVYEPDEKGLICMPTLPHDSPFTLVYQFPQPPSTGDHHFGRFFEMKGHEVFRWAVKRIPQEIKQILETSGLTQEEIKMVIPHQANQRIIDQIQRGILIPLYSNISQRGNTSSASIPLAIHDAQEEGRIEPGDKLILVGFGAGLLICTNIVQLGEKPKIPPVI